MKWLSEEDVGMRGHGDTETRGRGDAGTRGKRLRRRKDIVTPKN
ncbi:MAG: hypothetical protein RMY29_023985 [Nostoc sp. CreGUA01]|nr:hypothetical protein [Nostoc sp. CreGUA01]